MKKFIALIFVCVAVFSFTGCNEKVPAATPTPVPTGTPAPQQEEDKFQKASEVKILKAIEEILGQDVSFTGFENYSEEQKNSIVTKRLEANREATFQGNCFVEKDTETDEIITYCGEWLTPAMAEDITPPAFGSLRMVTSKETEFIAQYSDTEMKDVKAYAITLREAGYTVNSLEYDLSSIGEDTYSFTGANAEGVSIACLYIDTYLRITITAAK